MQERADRDTQGCGWPKQVRSHGWWQRGHARGHLMAPLQEGSQRLGPAGLRFLLNPGLGDLSHSGA